MPIKYDPLDLLYLFECEPVDMDGEGYGLNLWYDREMGEDTISMAISENDSEYDSVTIFIRRSANLSNRYEINDPVSIQRYKNILYIYNKNSSKITINFSEPISWNMHIEIV